MRVTIIADASYCNDTRVGGYGFWIASERGRLGDGGQINREVACNNTAEMIAIHNALLIGLQNYLIMKGDCVLIQSDCLGAIDRLADDKDWRDVTMREQQIEVKAAFFKLVEKAEITIEFRHVKGHTNLSDARFVANRMCDKRAKKHMRAARADKLKNAVLNSIRESFQ